MISSLWLFTVNQNVKIVYHSKCHRPLKQTDIRLAWGAKNYFGLALRVISTRVAELNFSSLLNCREGDTSDTWTSPKEHQSQAVQLNRNWLAGFEKVYIPMAYCLIIAGQKFFRYYHLLAGWIANLRRANKEISRFFLRYLKMVIPATCKAPSIRPVKLRETLKSCRKRRLILFGGSADGDATTDSPLKQGDARPRVSTSFTRQIRV